MTLKYKKTIGKLKQSEQQKVMPIRLIQKAGADQY